MSWPLIKLKDCCSVMGGATPKRNVEEYWDSKDVPWVTPKDISNLSQPVLGDAPEYISQKGFKSCATYILPKGSVLLTSRAPIGNVAIAGRDMCTNQGFKSLVPNNDVDGTYLYYCILAYSEKLQALGNGATFKEVSKKVVEEFEIPLPPLAEQRRIATILDKANSLRRKNQQAIQLADQFLRAVFLDMFGDPVTNPKGWERCKFESLINMVTYGLTVRPEYHEKGVPLISAREIRSGQINFDGAPKISEEDFEKLSEKARPNFQDILFSKTGSIGHCAIVESNIKFAVTQNAARIVSNTEKCEPLFLLSLLRTQYFFDLANREAKGNAVKDLQLGVMKEFPVYAPPLDIQRKYIEIFKRFKNLRSMNLRTQLDGNNLFDSVSQRIFIGKL